MGRIIPVILCGGSGTRLWPASRTAYPKQFLPLFEGISSFQSTLARIDDPTLFSPPIIVAGERHRFLALHELGSLGLEAEILLEPEPRDSGPAILAAALHVAARSPEAVVLVLAADHLVEGLDAFHRDCLLAARAAARGLIVTFGVKASRPATEFGYVHPGLPLDGIEGVFRVEAFVEKPPLERAHALLDQGSLWNCGNFCFRAGDLVGEYRAFDAATVEAVEHSVKAASRDLQFLRLGEDYGRSRRLSIDYAVMERTDRAVVLPASFRWSDIGSWQTLWELGRKDLNGNVERGPVSLADVENAYIDSDAAIATAVIGLSNVIVVVRRDAVLVAARDRAQDVRIVVDRLLRDRRPQAEEHPLVHRPWGCYQTLESGGRYRVKRLKIHPGGRLSLQKHLHRAEHWVVVSGTALVRIGEGVRTVHENESIFIPIGATHRLENPGRIDLEVVEVQSGSYTEEDDIIRIEDAYGR
ncbi:MAG: mannose-1-phosphate guanylyltransferase/mannose-6-phosphate isomerase [Parvibaculaceae bacterium]